MAETKATGWTLESLAQHMLTLISEHDKRYEERHQAQKELVALALVSAKEAVTKAETASDRRFEGVNEFRATLADQQRTLMPRQEVELLIKNMSSRLDSIDDTVQKSQAGRSGAYGGWLAAVGVVGFVIMVAVFVMTFVIRR